MATAGEGQLARLRVFRPGGADLRLRALRATLRRKAPALRYRRAGSFLAGEDDESRFPRQGTPFRVFHDHGDVQFLFQTGAGEYLEVQRRTPSLVRNFPGQHQEQLFDGRPAQQFSHRITIVGRRNLQDCEIWLFFHRGAVCHNLGICQVRHRKAKSIEFALLMPSAIKFVFART